MKTIILPQKVATGTAYACLRPIEKYPSSGAHTRSKEVLGLRMFPYAIFCVRGEQLLFLNIYFFRKYIRQAYVACSILSYNAGIPIFLHKKNHRPRSSNVCKNSDLRLRDQGFEPWTP